MKSLSIFFILLSFVSTSQEIDIPDTRFKGYLLNNEKINTNGDSLISAQEAENYKDSIFIRNMSISSLNGIESFVNLKYLNCSFNELTELDLSHNKALTHLNCASNRLINLEISDNASLTYLNCSWNKIALLNLGTITFLTHFECAHNKIISLDLRHLADLKHLDCQSNLITKLDVNNNRRLIHLNCKFNNIQNTLDLSNNTNLTNFDCESNYSLSIVFVTNIDSAICCFNKNYRARWFQKPIEGISEEVFEQMLSDSIENWNKTSKRSSLKMAISDMFYNSDYDNFLHIGVTNHYELLNYGLGGEIKLYGAYYHPLASGSIYVNYRHLFVEKSKSIPSNGISVGAHFTIFGLEANCYFNREEALFYLTPKLGFDAGSFSLFYGYSLSLNSSSFKGAYAHNISFKYHLYFGAFRYHKSRMEYNQI